MKLLLQLVALIALNATYAVAAVSPAETPEWLWLGCGKGKGNCGVYEDFQVEASATHELRCCSSVEVSGWTKQNGCDIWAQSDLIGEDGRVQCFHDVTYAEALDICALNGGYVCTKDQVDAGCTRSSGCGHDADLIWTDAEAPARIMPELPYQEPVDPEEWLYLECGKGEGQCGTVDTSAQAKDKHEVRCCSDIPLPGWMRSSGCENWHESELIALDGSSGTCFHESSYAEAQAICKKNDAYVCTQEQVKSGCVKGSGCGHDSDLIWTSTGPAPARTPLPAPAAVASDSHLFIACGAGINGCGGAKHSLGVAKANEQHEVRCCSPYSLPGWLKGGGCNSYAQSKLSGDQCFHASTYAEAQDICHENLAYVCSMSEVLDGCTKGTGCSHDSDFVWTSTPANAEAVAAYKVKMTQAAAISGVCVGTKARVSGDPHFTTFDKLKYDCQGHGEFVIAMSKGSDPLAIHGRFVRVRESKAKPTVTKSVAIKVVEEVPIIQVTAPPQKIDGKCPVTFTVGKEETPTEDIVSFVNANYNGTVNIFSNGRNIIFTYPGASARVQITAGGGGNRCVLNTNLCLTPEAHGGAENIVGLLGSPDGVKENDWMTRDGSFVPLPEVCTIPDPTNSETKECKKARNKGGHEWCVDNWCIGHADNSLWSEESHAEYNECDNREPDGFFDDIDDVDPAIVEACEGTEDPDGCVLDTAIAVEEGENVTEFVQTILEEDEDSNFVEKLDELDPSEALDDWDGPVLSAASAVEIEVPDDLPETADEETPSDASDPADSPTDTADIPDQPVSESSGSLGDPHFKTWVGEHFEYHGQCDMVLTRDHNFADGLGLEVQIRTKLVRFWSYIKRAAIRIGDDILEIEGSADPEDHDSRYWFNFQYQAGAAFVGGFPLKISNNGLHKRFYEIDLSSKYPGQKIVISSYREFVRVDFQRTTAEAFGNVVGMMGDFKTGNLLARDGVKEIHDFLEFGNEWQLLPADDMLFHDKAEPQFPKRCIVPEDPQGQRRRRLDESTITMEEAEAACSKVVGDALDIKDCVYDILATQDLNMVGAF
ncbi:unnamed protein product [Cylindrotheca closterium]|uniref:VWFD domain-containing protein n=1 Tax=Cylindrotheca closterium TaxID=2856 RepID=A0AAD2G177_9STRA|nr:unnamed protein product [Cylindrotheca closterium]